MVRTKQTAQGGASHRPEGMATATVTGTGKGKAGPEEQFIDAPGEDTEEDFLLVLEDAEKTCVSARINLAALLQVSKLSPANGGLNGPKIPFY